MSGQGSYDQSQAGNNAPHYGSNNPFAPNSAQHQHYPPQQQHQQQQGQAFNPTGYQPPPGPPPRRVGTFDETNFVPENERGEQREAMEQFELTKSGPEDTTDRDVAKLQQEFPNVDGSLIAAIYGDSKNLGATREMLQELAGNQS
nr:hypothetical protein CFP56_00297 [Quercus suber]